MWTSDIVPPTWPALIPVAAIIIAIVVTFPFMMKRESSLEREFDILQIQLELSLEDSDASIFDLYQNEELFLEETSGGFSPIVYG